MEARVERVLEQIRRAAADAETLLERPRDDEERRSLASRFGRRNGSFEPYDDEERRSMSSRVAHAKDQLYDLQREGARLARETRRYAAENPWRVTGAGIAAAVLAAGAVAWYVLGTTDKR